MGTCPALGGLDIARLADVDVRVAGVVRLGVGGFRIHLQVPGPSATRRARDIVQKRTSCEGSAATFKVSMGCGQLVGRSVGRSIDGRMAWARFLSISAGEVG